MPEIDREPFFGQHIAHQVMFAHRDAPGGHEQVGALRRRRNVAQCSGIIGRVADQYRHAAACRDEGGERQRVRADNLVRPDRIAGHDDLVAGREDADARPAMHKQPRPVHRRRETDVARGQSSPGLEQHIALGEIEPGAAHIAAVRRAFPDSDPVAVALGVLLNDDRIGAGRQWRAGEDPRRLAGPNRAAITGAGRDLGNDAQACGHLRDIIGAHGIAVHGGHRERRLRAPRRDILGQDASDRIGDRYLLGRQCHERRKESRQGLFNRNHQTASLGAS